MSSSREGLMRPIIGIENRTAQEVFDILCDRFRPAITAYEAAKGEGVEVKPLEWVKHPSADLWRADSLLGRHQVYAVISQTSWAFDAFDGITQASGDAGSIVAAKAAAQADYETRIRSALTSPASGTTRATAWENIHNGAIGRVDPGDPDNYIALGPIASPASGGRDAVIEECAKVADGIAATHRSIGKINLPSGGGPIIQEDRARVAEACAADIRALRMEGK